MDNNCAVKEAGKMMGLPMKELPVLAMDFLKYLSSKVGFCGETCMTAYSAYNQMVLKMSCDDDCYKVTRPDEILWWSERGYTL